MRRLCLIALSGALVLVGAGCTTEPDTAAQPAGTPAAAPAAPSVAPGGPAPAPGAVSSTAAAAGDAALKGNSAAICDQATTTGAHAGATFAQDLKLLIDAESAQDSAAVSQARSKTARDVQNYAYALADMGKLASEPDLKKALTTMSKQVGALKGDVRKLDATRLAGLQATLDKACGKG
ncbi:hypothetical protein EV385_4446 [Krasilnikovia cinnamomea]|uniref:Small secreted protein n=1 Tax=Krasilnikovia cinnamomea TaxID=349313 RepID=A0A4Q7ZNF9_9ACTN|nr:hypothetical protein [Krasilnikovia cinnamomea]RZU52572.1 hypothetical protein EV385_4446 [Krasilnikovia cinnamomea]